MSLAPLRDLVLIRADERETQTASGILLAEEKWKTLPPTGTVEAVGPEVTIVKVGDHVMFERYGSVILEEKSMRLCKENLIQGVL